MSGTTGSKPCAQDCSCGKHKPRGNGGKSEAVKIAQRQRQRCAHVRGRASLHKCEHCGGQATDWAHIHGRSGEDIYDLMPLCHPCHMAYDMKGNKNASGNKGKPKSAEHKRKIALALIGNQNNPSGKRKPS
jgi:hypothetical protein